MTPMYLKLKAFNFLLHLKRSQYKIGLRATSGLRNRYSPFSVTSNFIANFICLDQLAILHRRLAYRICSSSSSLGRDKNFISQSFLGSFLPFGRYRFKLRFMRGVLIPLINLWFSTSTRPSLNTYWRRLIV